MKQYIEGEKPTKRFVPPSPAEVRDYCSGNGYNVDCERFVDFYESKNWYVGKNKMKDWKAAVRSWHSRNKTEGRHITESKTAFSGEDRIEAKMFTVPVFED